MTQAAATETLKTQSESQKRVQLNSQRLVLANGLVLLVTENPTADIVAARLFIDAGSRYEQPDQAGLSHLVAALLSKGTPTHTSQEIAAQVESIGANLGVSSAPDYFVVSVKTVSTDFAELLALAAELIQFPIFPEAELALERKLTIQAIRARQEQPMAIALQQLRQAIHSNHPYGQPGLGTLETIASLERNNLIEFHRQHFRPNTAVLSIAGNITVENAQTLAESLFGDWKISSLVPPTLPDIVEGNRPIQVMHTQPTQQSIVMLGYPAPAVQEADYAALKLLYTYLCSGLSSRLFTELREKKGLAYEVSGFYPTRLHPSHFGVYLGTASENTALALSLLKAEIERLSAQMLSAEEVDATKSKLLGQYALGKQTNHQIAHLYGLYAFLQLGADYDQQFVQNIQVITPKQLQNVAIKHLREPFISLVGPESALASLGDL
jgi:predicted Zn-dependent peptidase